MAPALPNLTAADLERLDALVVERRDQAQSDFDEYDALHKKLVLALRGEG